jgi:hypothetical protein
MEEQHTIIRLQGGLGNQMFQYALGLAFEGQTGSNILYDLSFFEPRAGDHVPRRAELGVFGIRPSSASHDRLQAAIQRGQGWRGRLSRILPALFPPGVVYERSPYTFDPAIFKAPTGSILDGYWQSERYFGSVREQVRTAFRFAAALQARMEPVAQRIAGTPDAVSLHVRRGDYVHHAAAQSTFVTCDKDYYQRAAAFMLERYPEARFFVFSDDPGWVRANLALPNMELVEGNTGIHSPDDMRLMSQCRHHIIANSSFSWWGAWLAQRTDGSVVAPARWLKDSSITTPDLLPPAWTTL